MSLDAVANLKSLTISWDCFFLIKHVFKIVIYLIKISWRNFSVMTWLDNDQDTSTWHPPHHYTTSYLERNKVYILFDMKTRVTYAYISKYQMHTHEKKDLLRVLTNLCTTNFRYSNRSYYHTVAYKTGRKGGSKLHTIIKML